MTCYKRVQGEHKRGAGWKVRRIRDSWLQTHRLESPQVKLGVIISLATGHVSPLVFAVYFPCSQDRKHCISVFAATSSSVRPQPPVGREAVLSGTPFPAARWRPSSFEQQLLAGHSSSPIKLSVPTEAPSGTEAAFPAPALELESSPEGLTL